MGRLATVILTLFVAHLSISAYINLSFDSETWGNWRNSVMFGRALADCFGKDTLIDDIKKRRDWAFVGQFDSLGHLKHMKYLIRRERNNKRERSRMAVDDSIRVKLQKYLIDNDVPFTFPEETNAYLKKTKESVVQSAERWFKGGGVWEMTVNWPSPFWLEIKADDPLWNPSDFISQKLDSIHGFMPEEDILTDNQNFEKLSAEIVPAEEDYNTAQLLISMLYVFGGRNLENWLTEHKFAICIEVDNDGMVESITNENGKSPLNEFMLVLLAKFMKLNNVKILVPRADTKEIHVDFPGIYQLTDDFHEGSKVKTNIYRMGNLLRQARNNIRLRESLKDRM